jgi:hypothetical protein
MATADALFVNDNTVWVTDGTTSGTHQLLLRADPGQQLEGIMASPYPDYFHVFNNNLLFFELEYSTITGYHVQVYTTNGSAAGTKEFTVPLLSNSYPSYLTAGDFAEFDNKLLILDNVTSIAGKPPKVEFLVTNLTKTGTKTFTINGPKLPYSFDPSEFTGLGNLVLFSAVDRNGISTLWASNGTAAGTTPLSIKGAAASGLAATDLTVFGKEILFSGADNAGYRGLWVTDGTAKDTHEIVQTGEPFGFAESLNPEFMTVVAGKQVFFAADGGLWKTNGTALGTKEIVVPGGYDNGLDVNPEYPGLVRFGSKVLFVGTTASGATDIFVSDGTSKGSYALTWSGTAAENFEVFGNQVLFEAEDASRKEGLWITNGSKNGTHEIKISMAYSQGFFSLVSFAGAAIGKEFVFSGTNVLEQTGLWVTNGTTTHQINAPLSVSDLTAVPATKAAQLLAAAGDVLIAGHHSALTGTKGADLFKFATPGSPLHPDSNVVAHFDARTDKIAFSDPGFRLELANPSATPQTLPADLFTANPIGSFTDASERLAYDTSTGALYYDPHGDKPGSSRELVATFTGHPQITAGNVFFVS